MRSKEPYFIVREPYQSLTDLKIHFAFIYFHVIYFIQDQANLFQFFEYLKYWHRSQED